MTVAKYHDGTAWRNVVSLTGPQGPPGVGQAQDEGVVLPQRPNLNFTGPSVTATDDAANNRTNVAVAPNVPVVTQPSALPSSPVDGQEVIYAPNFDPYPYWHFKYRASSGFAYKWECIGGMPLIARDDTDRPFSANGAFGITSNILQITLPLAGDYDVITTVNIYGESVSGTYQCGVGDTSAVIGQFAAQGSTYAFSGIAVNPWSNGRIAGNTAGRVLRHYVAAPSGQTVHPRGRLLSIMPVRVG